MRQLERLSIVHLGAVFAGLVGQREGPSGGRGVEFADYRPYHPGDDLRRIDWNVYARLGQAFVKTSPSEAHVDVALLLDASASMAAGPGSRFRYAQQLAALLGAVALLRSDAVDVHALADGGTWRGGTLRAPQDVATLVEELGSVKRGTRTDLAASVLAYRRSRADSAVDVAILITDGLVEPEELRAAAAELAGSARTAALLHVVADDEAQPAFDGAAELIDRETGERLLVDLTPSAREQLARRVQERADAAQAAAAAHGVAYVRAVTSRSPLDLLFDAARRAELVAT